jgi:hypothetical protein
MILEARNYLFRVCLPVENSRAIKAIGMCYCILLYYCITGSSALEGNVAEIDAEQRVGGRGNWTRALAVVNGRRLLSP